MIKGRVDPFGHEILIPSYSNGKPTAPESFDTILDKDVQPDFAPPFTLPRDMFKIETDPKFDNDLMPDLTPLPTHFSSPVDDIRYPDGIFPASGSNTLEEEIHLKRSFHMTFGGGPFIESWDKITGCHFTVDLRFKKVTYFNSGLFGTKQYLKDWSLEFSHRSNHPDLWSSMNRVSASDYISFTTSHGDTTITQDNYATLPNSYDQQNQSPGDGLWFYLPPQVITHPLTGVPINADVKSLGYNGIYYDLSVDFNLEVACNCISNGQQIETTWHVKYPGSETSWIQE